MKSYSDCYIAFIDILGFKEMVTNHSCNDIYDLYRRRMIKPMTSFTHGEKPVPVDQFEKTFLVQA